MALRITKLSLRDFRNYEELEIEPDSELTVFVGPNAAGKTNAIEAVEILTTAMSFRKPQWGECVRWGQEKAKAVLVAEGDGRLLELAVDITASGRRTYSLNGTTKRRLTDVVGKLPCVLFTPDDLRMVKDSADRRRSALDEVGDQLSAAYATTRADYDRIVRQRNAILKDPQASPAELAVWTERLIEKGESFSGHRSRLFERLSKPLSEAYASLSNGENLDAVYLRSWEREGQRSVGAEMDLRAAVESSSAAERARGTSLQGPHRDDVLFLVEGKPARAYASQGQQRTIALAWKLAEVAVITEIAGQEPVLLLDDVMSELDQGRRHALASLVGASAQAFITTTNLGYFDEDLVGRAKVVTLG